MPSSYIPRDSFPTIQVSSQADELILDLEAAWCRMYATPAEDQCAVGNAYAALSERRKGLYQHIHQLEAELLGIGPMVRKRFD